MTTIAANLESMAADSLTATEDGLIVDERTEKITRINGCIIGCEGDDDYISLFLDWFRKGQDLEDRPELEHGEFAAIVLRPHGLLVKYFAGCFPVAHNADWLTLGAGCDIAAGAMACGATPRQAVEVACKLNVWTGGEVVEERL